MLGVFSYVNLTRKKKGIIMSSLVKVKLVRKAIKLQIAKFPSIDVTRERSIFNSMSIARLRGWIEFYSTL